MSFRSLLIKSSFLKVPSLKGVTEDLYARAVAFAATTPDSDARDEAGAQLVLAAHALIAAGRRHRVLCTTSATPVSEEKKT